MLLSRSIPAPKDIQRGAEILSGEIIEQDWDTFWDDSAVVEEATEGEPIVLRDYTHENPTMRALMREATHSAVVQAERGRASRRGETQMPLTTLVCNDIPVPFRINRHRKTEEVLHWAALCAHAHGVMPDLSGPKGRINHLLPLLLPELVSNVVKASELRRHETKAVYAPPYEGWHLRFRKKGAGGKQAWFHHVVVDADDSITAKAVLLEALKHTGEDWYVQSPQKRKQPSLRAELRRKATEVIEPWQ